jgi:hypothetical protein
MSYWLWGRERELEDTVIALWFDQKTLSAWYQEVSELEPHVWARGAPQLAPISIHVCRHPRLGSQELWQRLKRFAP